MNRDCLLAFSKTDKISEAIKRKWCHESIQSAEAEGELIRSQTVQAKKRDSDRPFNFQQWVSICGSGCIRQHKY